jgi:acyl phosphate:glycerol-3-phosphate acyltransferase
MGSSTNLLTSLAAIVAAYLVGSLSFAVIISRVFGLADPRSYGSKNPGATNVLRSGHRAAAILTLVLDALKGFVPVVLALPVFFRFEGGKGVATAAGVLLGFNPWLGAATLLTWVVIAAFFRYSSLASIVSAAFAPFYQLLIWEPSPIALAIAVMSLLLIWRHSGNIRKLLAGTESRLGQKAAAPVTAAHGHRAHHGHDGKHEHNKRKGH